MFPLTAASNAVKRRSALLIDAQRRGYHRANPFLLIVAEILIWWMLAPRTTRPF